VNWPPGGYDSGPWTAALARLSLAVRQCPSPFGRTRFAVLMVRLGLPTLPHGACPCFGVDPLPPDYSVDSNSSASIAFFNPRRDALRRKIFLVIVIWVRSRGENSSPFPSFSSLRNAFRSRVF
jgi:hypothetical protein